MAYTLNFNGTARKKLFFNGAEMKEAKHNGTLRWKARTDTETLSVSTGSAENSWVYSSTITAPEGFTKLVIETASAGGGNYGMNYARLVVNGTQNQQSNGSPGVNVSSWVTSYSITAGNTFYLIGRSERDYNRDDHQDALVITITYHFE